MGEHYLPTPPARITEEPTARQFQFDEFTLDQSRYRLERDGLPVRLEKIPMELLLLLVERGGDLVTREEIASHLWGSDVFVDVDHGINTAIRKVRFALHDDSEKPHFIETVVGKGYRFAAPVNYGNGHAAKPVQTLPAPVALAPDPVALATAKRQSPLHSWALLGAAAALVVFALLFVLRRASPPRAATQTGIKSIAVLPLKNLSGDPAQEYLADGMTEALIGRLSGIHNLRVISRTSVMRFKDAQPSIPEIARTLNVDAFVEGSVIREGSRIRINAQLIRAATDEHFWSESYDREAQDVLALQSDVAQAIASKVEVTVTGKEHESLVTVRAVSAEAYEGYLKGSYALRNSHSKSETELSIGYFETATKNDPAFAPAYVGLADAYGHLSTIILGAPPQEFRPKEIAAVRKALELDPKLAEAHVLLATTLQRDWQWADAEAEYKRAIELNPNNADAYTGLADWLACQGRMDEALAAGQRSRALDPISGSGGDMSWILFMAHRYDDAIRELHSFLTVRPDSPFALHTLGFALIASGHPEQAIPVLEKDVAVSGHSPGPVSALANAYGHAGRRVDALRLIAELKRKERTEYVPPGAFVIAYLGLGDSDKIFEWLDRAYGEKSNILQFIKVHPFFDPLRGDARFADLLRRVGLS